MQVVVDEPGGVLEVETFGEHVGGHQHADLGITPRGEVRRTAAVVVGREAPDHVGPVDRRAAVDAGDAVDAGFAQVRLDVAGGVGELGEHQHLATCQIRGAQEADQLLQLVVLCWLEPADHVDESHDLVEVGECLLEDRRDVVLLPGQIGDRLEQLRRDDVLFRVLLGVLLSGFVAVEVEMELTLGPVADHLGMPALPGLVAIPLGVGVAVDLHERQQLAHEPVEGLLEGEGRTLEPLQEQGADEAHHLALAVLLERVDAAVGTGVVSQRVVDGEGEQGVLLLEGLLEHVQHPSVGGPDGVLGHLWRFPVGERGAVGAVGDLAGPGIPTAALHHQRREHRVLGEHLLGRRGETFVQRFGQMAFHGVEVPCQVVDAQAASEVGLVAAGEQLGHVSEISQAVVDRRGREQEHQLGAHVVVQQVEEAPVAGALVTVVLGLAAAAAVAEVVSLVDDHRVGQLGDAPEPLGEVCRHGAGRCG